MSDRELVERPAWAMSVRQMSLDLQVQRATKSVATPEDEQFQHWAELALAGTENTYTLAIRIVDEEEGQRFNHDYRGKDYPSNVLSFPAELHEGLPAEIQHSQLGDLLICAPVVAREAVEQGKKEIDHWAHLTVHGVLHLLGYDHEDETEAHRMEALETEILAKAGISDPYQDT
jgi:probable rRNA maturation factor